MLSSPRVMVLTARGAEQHSNGSDTVLAWINLVLALGMVGKRGTGYGCLTGQGNGQGGREHGQKADQLPGYRRIDDPAAPRPRRRRVGRRPRLAARPRPVGVRDCSTPAATDDGPLPLLVLGSNVVVSAPNATQVDRAAGGARPAGGVRRGRCRRPPRSPTWCCR